MRRREFLLAATAAAASRRAGSQEVPKSEALARLGWVEGHNLTVERRITGGDPEQRKTAAIELVAANPGVIVAAGIADALTVHAQTHTLPIVVITGRDIVEAGLADSLAHPGGNVTGVINLGGELDGNRIELLHELVPAATRISVLVYARLPRSAARVTAIEALARPLGLRVTKRPVSEAREIDDAFAASAADQDQAILVEASAPIVENRPRVLALQRNTGCLRFTSGASLSRPAVCCPTDSCSKRISSALPRSSTRS